MIYTFLFSFFFLICFLPKELRAEEISASSLQAAFISRFIDFTERKDFKDRQFNICIQSSENSPKKEDFGDLNLYKMPVNLEFFLAKNQPDDCSVIVTERHLATKRKTLEPLKIALNEERCDSETHIRFLLQNNKLRFAVNLQKVKEDGFELSSKLLALAIIENC